MGDRKSRVLAGLAREMQAAGASELAAQTAKLAVLVKARVAVDSGTATAAEVSRALGIHHSTWRRWSAELGLQQLARECVAAMDESLREAGADDETTVADVAADPDLELAAGRVGVWKR